MFEVTWGDLKLDTSRLLKWLLPAFAWVGLSMWVLLRGHLGPSAVGALIEVPGFLLWSAGKIVTLTDGPQAVVNRRVKAHGWGAIGIPEDHEAAEEGIIETVGLVIILAGLSVQGQFWILW